MTQLAPEDQKTKCIPRNTELVICTANMGTGGRTWLPNLTRLLLWLQEHFRLGILTSATMRTMTGVMYPTGQSLVIQWFNCILAMLECLSCLVAGAFQARHLYISHDANGEGCDPFAGGCSWPRGASLL